MERVIEFIVYYWDTIERIRRTRPGFWEALVEVYRAVENARYTDHGAVVREFPTTREAGVQAQPGRVDAATQTEMERRETSTQTSPERCCGVNRQGGEATTRGETDRAPSPAGQVQPSGRGRSRLPDSDLRLLWRGPGLLGPPSDSGGGTPCPRPRPATGRGYMLLEYRRGREVRTSSTSSSEEERPLPAKPRRARTPPYARPLPALPPSLTSPGPSGSQAETQGRPPPSASVKGGGAVTGHRPTRGANLCWNCQSPTHRYSDCPLPRDRSYCYGCGREGVTMRTCPQCGEEWRNLGPYHPQKGHLGKK